MRLAHVSTGSATNVQGMVGAVAQIQAQQLHRHTAVARDDADGLNRLARHFTENMNFFPEEVSTCIAGEASRFRWRGRSHWASA